MMPPGTEPSGQLQVAMVSHDLRAPLHAIVLGLELLRTRPLGSPQDQVVQRMYRAAQRMAFLLDRILTSPVQAGPVIPLQPAPLELSGLCRELFEELHMGHPDRQLTLTADEGIEGSWDRLWLVELLSNLVENALEHGDPAAAVAVDVRKKGELAQIEVSNRGPGIPPELRKAIFAPFRRGPGRSGTHGVGLGLYIVAQIAAAHGGAVEVSSESGVTRFTVTLPLGSP